LRQIKSLRVISPLLGLHIRLLHHTSLATFLHRVLIFILFRITSFGFLRFRFRCLFYSLLLEGDPFRDHRRFEFRKFLVIFDLKVFFLIWLILYTLHFYLPILLRFLAIVIQIDLNNLVILLWFLWFQFVIVKVDHLLLLLSLLGSLFIDCGRWFVVLSHCFCHWFLVLAYYLIKVFFQGTKVNVLSLYWLLVQLWAGILSSGLGQL